MFPAVRAGCWVMGWDADFGVPCGPCWVLGDGCWAYPLLSKPSHLKVFSSQNPLSTTPSKVKPVTTSASLEDSPSDHHECSYIGDPYIGAPKYSRSDDLEGIIHVLLIGAPITRAPINRVPITKAPIDRASINRAPYS